VSRATDRSAGGSRGPHGPDAAPAHAPGCPAPPAGPSRGARRPSVWAAPLGIGAASAAGLAAALVSDSWGDVTAWIGLGLPLTVIAWYLTRP